MNIANASVGDSDKKFLGDAECAKRMMWEKRSIEHVEVPFARERNLHMRRLPAANTVRKPKCDSNPSDGRSPARDCRRG